MRATLYNLAIAHNDYFVTVADCAQAVGNDDAGASPAFDIVDDFFFYQRIQSAGGFVHN